jgi:hypothetical protein
MAGKGTTSTVFTMQENLQLSAWNTVLAKLQQTTQQQLAALCQCPLSMATIKLVTSTVSTMLENVQLSTLDTVLAKPQQSGHQ